jgi:hypothetical protein
LKTTYIENDDILMSFSKMNQILDPMPKNIWHNFLKFMMLYINNLSFKRLFLCVIYAQVETKHMDELFKPLSNDENMSACEVKGLTFLTFSKKWKTYCKNECMPKNLSKFTLGPIFDKSNMHISTFMYSN